MQTLQDLDNLTKDYTGNYSTGTARDEVRYRAENRAIEMCKRLVGLPNDEEIYSFYYTEDQLFYDLPSKFIEAFDLKYNNPNFNTKENKWDYFDYPHVLQGAGGVKQNRWSITHINGRKQVILAGYNGLQGSTILSMDSATNWAASDDASGLVLDSDVKYQGTGSISFDITASAGVATISRTGLNLDFSSLFNRSGYLKFFAYMTDNDIDSITLRLQSSSGNYYTITVTVADDGTAFAQDEWQKIGFSTVNAIATGTPDTTAITQIDFEFDLGSGFVSAADFRIDQLFTSFPELMDLYMFTDTKGTNNAGDTNKTELTSPDDILYWSGEYEDFTDLVAQRAAINLWPQLRGDKEQYVLLKQDFRDNLKTFARRWPRKRLQSQRRHQLRR